MNGRVRPALPRDLDALYQLETNFPGDRLSRRSFRHLLNKGNADVLVFEIHDKIVGNAVVLYRVNSSNARLYSLVVDPQHQQQGIAHTLVLAVEAATATRGCNFISLELRPDNEPALRLYERLGYVSTMRKEAFYEDGSAALCMRKFIAGG